MQDRVVGCGGEFDVCMCVGFAGIEVHRGIKGGGGDGPYAACQGVLEDCFSPADLEAITTLAETKSEYWCFFFCLSSTTVAETKSKYW